MRTIGSPARLSEAVKNQRLAHAETVPVQPSDLIEAHAIWQGSGALADPIGRVGGVLNRLLRRNGPAADGAAHAQGPPTFVGLRRMVEEIHDIARVTYGRNTIDIAVPHTHVAILTEQDADNFRPIEDQLEHEVWSDFGRFVDPRLGVRIRFFQVHGGSRQIVYFIGGGIHIPDRQRAAAACAGELLLRRGKAGKEFTPTLPGGTPAAFHPGQTGLAFSGLDSLTPAICTPILEAESQEHGSYFYLGRRRDIVGVTFQGVQAPRAKPTRSGVSGLRYMLVDETAGGSELRDNSLLAPGRWYGVRRYVQPAGGGPWDRQDVFEFRFSGDGLRPGRLQTAKSSGPVLNLMGLLVPNPAAVRSIKQLWIDFTPEGHLCSHWLATRAFSLVIGATGFVAVYDRSTCSFVEAGVSSSKMPAVAVGDHVLTVEPVSESNGRMLEIRPEPGARLGFMALPEPANAPRFTVTPIASNRSSDLSFDWLDAAGLVEIADSGLDEDGVRTVHRLQQRYKGLSEWHKTASCMMEWEAGRRLAAHENVGGSVTLESGDFLDVGPLRLQFVRS
ncbi:MAG: hypothetical protein ACREC6_12830 [Hyphomicrobiaceae bacterium]